MLLRYHVIDAEHGSVALRCYHTHFASLSWLLSHLFLQEPVNGVCPWLPGSSCRRFVCKRPRSVSPKCSFQISAKGRDVMHCRFRLPVCLFAAAVILIGPSANAAEFVAKMVG